MGVNQSVNNFFITGAAGFLGGRLVEKIAAAPDCRVKVLVRNLSKAARIARFPVNILQGRMDNTQALEEGVREANIIIHCAHDFEDQKSNIHAAKALKDLCLKYPNVK